MGLRPGTEDFDDFVSGMTVLDAAYCEAMAEKRAEAGDGKGKGKP